MIDTSEALREFLAAQSSLAAWTGARLWAERESPPKEYKPSDGGAICFKRRGGGYDEEGVILMSSYQFKCYGATEMAANGLYRALWDVLIDRRSYLIKAAEQEAQGQTLYEPKTGWPYVLTFYRLLILN